MGDADEEQRLAQQVYLVIKADVDKDGKNSNSQVLGVYFTDSTALSRAQAEFVDVLKETTNLDEDAEVDLEEYSKAGDESLIYLLTKEVDKETGLYVSVRVEEHRVLDFSDVFETPGEEGEEEEYDEDEGGDDDGEEGDQEGDQDDEEGDQEAEEEEDEDEPPAKVARKRG